MHQPIVVNLVANYHASFLTLCYIILSFNYPDRKGYQTHSGKRKMMVTSIFSSSYYCVYPWKDKSQQVSSIYFVVCKYCHLDQPKIWWGAKKLTLSQTTHVKTFQNWKSLEFKENCGKLFRRVQTLWKQKKWLVVSIFFSLLLRSFRKTCTADM